METSNETLVVGLVPRAVAVALACVATASTSLGTAVLLTSGAEGSGHGFLALAVAPLQALLGL